MFAPTFLKKRTSHELVLEDTNETGLYMEQLFPQGKAGVHYSMSGHYPTCLYSLAFFRLIESLGKLTIFKAVCSECNIWNQNWVSFLFSNVSCVTFHNLFNLSELIFLPYKKHTPSICCPARLNRRHFLNALCSLTHSQCLENVDFLCFLIFQFAVWFWGTQILQFLSSVYIAPYLWLELLARNLRNKSEN